MKKAIADKWVAALRSGKYAQTRNVLRDTKGYCCLGVLCDILGETWTLKKDPEDLPDWVERPEDGVYVTKEATKQRAGISILPHNIANAAEMKTLTGDFYDPDKYERRLSALNDKGYDFNNIADVIEKHWEEL